MELVEGIYENLISNSIEQMRKELAINTNLICKEEEIDSAESPKMLAGYLAEIIRHRLEDDSISNEERIQFVNQILETAKVPDEEILIPTNNYLSAVISKQKNATLAMTGKKMIRPQSGFRLSNLFTGGQSMLPLNEEIIRDIASADHICLIVSFLKLSGTRLLLNHFKDFCSQSGHSLRIITTTYCGATDAKAVQQLSELPNTEIRISYNTSIERLHAKAYIFERNSGLSTAYIGSSNLSKSAQTDGLEWNIRVTNVENPHIIKTALATFERYWNSPRFEDFKDGGIEKFYKELRKQKIDQKQISELQKYTILPHQKMILDKLLTEREENKIFRNLIVAATGTGKTVISAFDYQYYRRKYPQQCRILFVAHREEILKQSLRTYQSVLQDANFGELWVGNCSPDNKLEALFISVQTANSQFSKLSELGADYYNYIVIDEAHHMTAESYQRIISYFNPQILVGLTATPERMDGASLLPDFDNRISAEIRLPQALSEGLLTPFQYLCITDTVDLGSKDLWDGRKYIPNKLADKLCDKERVSCIYRTLQKYIADEQSCKALCFCVNRRHADFMSQEFCRLGFKAASLTCDNKNDRNVLNRDIAEGKINYLFVVDMFNEGIDIPEIDTVLFLRPTESLTIFLQQLGRGLRLSVGKTVLTVLDFVAQSNKNYDFTSRFRSLLLKTSANVEEQVKNGFTLLPQGCYIHMEEKAQKYILENIHAAIYNLPRLTKELSGYPHCPSLSDFLEGNGQDIRLIYRNNNCWTSLKKAAGKCQYTSDKNTRKFEKGMNNFIHINSMAYLRFIKRFLHNGFTYNSENKEESTFAIMLYYTLFQETISKTGFSSISEAFNCFGKYPLFVQEVEELINYITEHLEILTFSIGNGMPATLEQYGCYTREEIFAIFNRQTAIRKMQGLASGAYKVDELKTELLFVTLNKSDKEFSPSTQYEDYLISDKRFHWQSQNSVSHASTGKRFVQQKQEGRKFLLFVRENKKDGYGNTCPYYCFGFVDYVRSSGDKPMNIEWELREPAMPQFLKVI